jgi:hypothetical protein
MPNLTVINGDGDGTKSGKARSERAFRPHYLAEHLWKAIYPKPASHIAQIAERMTKTFDGEVTTIEVHACLWHVRKHCYKYEWTVPHVGRGRSLDRCYTVVLVDASDKKIVVGEHMDSVKSGSTQTMLTIKSMAINQAAALDMIADDLKDLAPADRRKLRAAGAAFEAAAQMATEALAKVNRIHA